MDSNDEEETVSECENDVETSWNMIWSSFVYKGFETSYVWLYFVKFSKNKNVFLIDIYYG